MSIRIKIVMVVLPVLIATIILVGVSSYFQARTGINKLARDFLGFKVSELQKKALSDWQLIVDQGYSENPGYVNSIKGSIALEAETLVRSESEWIFAIDNTGDLGFSTLERDITAVDRVAMLDIFSSRPVGLETTDVFNEDRVYKGFYFQPFDWYFIISELEETFYSDIYKISLYTSIILAASIIVASIILFAFAGLLTNPLSRIIDTMKSIISSGKMDEKVEIEYQDETGTLAHTFNIMISELNRAYGQIKNYAFKSVVAAKRESKIRNIFQKYVPQELIDQYFENPESMLVGENRVLSILFSDIRNFTTISESMRPDDLVDNLNQYFKVMVDIIDKYEGKIDKYIGDAIMAMFGAPVKHEFDAMNSVLAAIDMCNAADRFNEKQLSRGRPAFRIGVGVNYGLVTVGNIGTDKKMDYTVIGDMVNLASRLEGLTKEYKTDLIISESLHYKIKNDLPCRLLDKVAVKGKAQGVKIYTTKRTVEGTEKRAWDLHNEAMIVFYDRKFKEAASMFQEVKSLLKGNDYIAGELLGRCKEYMQSPPPQDWVGIKKMDKK
jgi:adenylate cyclase